VKLSDLAGRPVLLFFWAHGCGDCKAEAGKLARLREKYSARGLALVAPTRLYGTGAENKAVTPAEEKAQIVKTLSESYPGLSGVSVPVDTETMVRYGASATPSYALLDKTGRVRFYTPTRVSEAELSKRIEALLAE
jgi:thiol-disulfide isomerase/thioredoxin